MNPIALLAQAGEGNIYLQFVVAVLVLVNTVALFIWLFQGMMETPSNIALARAPRIATRFLAYELLIFGAFVMLVPFYWMVVTSYKDEETSAAFPPVWLPMQVARYAENPEGEMVAVVPLETARQAGEMIRVVPEENFEFRRVDAGEVSITRETVTDEASVFMIDPADLVTKRELSLSFRNFKRAWYRPEEATRGQVNFLTYFIVSLVSSGIVVLGVTYTSALAAFAFARLEFWGKSMFFYIILATMMVPGQVLLIPNFLILERLGWLDTYLALIVPWLASVFTIFLMRQFFMTIPNDLWDAARIDGASRFRFLWQIVMPLSKPVFITAGIFNFLANWNSLLWPLIVTSSPKMRTLMVGLQNISEEASAEFHILMAASSFAVIPVVICFFFLQRFFIEGIARTGLK